ncbi:MAG: hypothetical protein JWM50_2153 [Microbacteriaceae bacterium]|nr:hypothetical protein [Microbacteriaceae bacterium]
MVEAAAIDRASTAPEHVFEELSSIVTETEERGAASDWSGVGTAGVRFHQAIIKLAQSPLMNEYFANIVAQLRLVLAFMPDEGEFQKIWTPRDREIYESLVGGRRDQARRELMSYLDDSEALIIENLRALDRRR